MATKKLVRHERITADPAILAGKPVIKGTRISVELVLEHLADNPDIADLYAAYPDLTVEDVKAALAYARDVLDGELVEPEPYRLRTRAANPRV